MAWAGSIIGGVMVYGDPTTAWPFRNNCCPALFPWSEKKNLKFKLNLPPYLLFPAYLFAPYLFSPYHIPLFPAISIPFPTIFLPRGNNDRCQGWCVRARPTSHWETIVSTIGTPTLTSPKWLSVILSRLLGGGQRTASVGGVCSCSWMGALFFGRPPPPGGAATHSEQIVFLHGNKGDSYSSSSWEEYQISPLLTHVFRCSRSIF